MCACELVWKRALKSDRFGMEISSLINLPAISETVKIRPFRYGNGRVRKYIKRMYGEVKIRPFRYGNLLIFSAIASSKILLKSDRFGMEILLSPSIVSLIKC